jgi:hypothetical protein
MPLTNIQADDIPGTQNRALFQELRDLLAAQFPADAPCLLFPVRLETRFMHVERPVAAGRTDDLIERTGKWVVEIETLAELDLVTRFEDPKQKKAVKKHEASLHKDLEGRTRPPERLLEELARTRDFDRAQHKQLGELAKRAKTALDRAQKNIATLRSSWLNKYYSARLDSLAALEIPEQLELIYRRAELWNELRVVKAADVLDERADSRAVVLGAPKELELLASKMQIAHLDSAAIAQTLQSYTALVQALKDSDARTVEKLCQQIVILPEARKLELLHSLPRTARLERAAIETIRSDGLRPARVERAAGVVLVAPESAQMADELWVRAYPDDISIDTHEPELTDQEVEEGRRFWLETSASAGDLRLEKGAFRALAARFGARRAAWIARCLKPVRVERTGELGPLTKALEMLDRRLSDVAAVRGAESRFARLIRAFNTAEEAVRVTQRGTETQLEHVRALLLSISKKVESLREQIPLVDITLLEQFRSMRHTLRAIEEHLERVKVLQREDAELEFPDVPRKAAAWTRAATAPLTPERFVIVAVDDNDRVAHLVVGEQIAGLKVGIDPSEAARTTEQFVLDGNGDLVAGESIRWMIDFDTAVRRGLGFIVPITSSEALRGFKRVYALGISNLDRTAGRAAVSSLFLGHRFSESGLGFLPIGTPTNNTEEGPSAHSSANDADAVYALELGAPGFTNAASEEDGACFVRALGLDAELAQHLANAGTRDVAEAALVNRALWPATGGAYLEEMTGTLFSLDSIDRIGAYFERWVAGRGPVPAIRLGEQPYGIQVTTAYSRFIPRTGATIPNAAQPTSAQLEQRFYILLRDVLEQAARDWRRVAAVKVNHAHTGSVTDAQAHFLDMLGLHPSSVARSYRFALNCARRTPGSGSSDIRFGLIPTEGPFGLLTLFERVIRAAFNAPGNGTKGADGLVLPELVPAMDALTGTRAFGVRVLDRENELGGALVGENVAARVASILSRSLAALSSDAALGDSAPPASLFVLLARQARLMRALDVGLRIFTREGMMTPEIRRDAGSADTFAIGTLYGSVYVTRWSYLFEPPSELDGRFGLTFPAGPGTLYRYLSTQAVEPPLAQMLSNDTLYNAFPQHAQHDADRARLHGLEADLSASAAIPRERLERLVSEHLDVVSTRLDAWRVGLARMRLEELRGARAEGLYAGAFGCLVDVRPGGKRERATELPEALRDAVRPTYTDKDTQGFVLAPSPVHAVTAAILRSGYLSESTVPDLDNRMAVNLSSRRVRLAQSILDAVRSGIDLGAALGYRFERALHDTHEREGITLDEWIAPLRRKFPTAGAVDPSSDDADRAQRQVIDGLELLETVRANSDSDTDDRSLFETLEDGGRFPNHPWGLEDASGVLIPDTDDPAELRAMLRAIDELADALDALGDLTVAESVFQIARGNLDRAAAVMASAAEGRAMPEPEIVRTPRTGRLVSQKLLLAVPSIDPGPLRHGTANYALARDAARPAGWTHSALGPRAAVEPGFNTWAASLLGPASDIVALVATEGEAPLEVTAAQLGVQPLDLVHDFAAGIEEGLSLVAARIAAFVRPVAADPGAEPEIEVQLRTRGGAWPIEKKTFLEVAPLFASLRKLAGEARAADATDLQDSDTAAAGVVPIDNAELEMRAAGALAELESLVAMLADVFAPGAAPTLDALLADARAFLDVNLGVFGSLAPLVWAARPSLFALLDDASSFGITGVAPPARFDSLGQAANELRARVERAFLEGLARISAARARAGDPKAVLQAVFGKSFFVLPRFLLSQATEARDALAANVLASRNAGPLALADWFHGVSAVRARPRVLERIGMLADAFDRPLAPARAVQFPERADEHWLGGRLQDAGAPDGDRLSLVVFGAGHLTATHGAALIVDEWNEVIPDRVQSTAAAFHYDAPDAAAPQVLMLVTPPELGGQWRFEDLLMAIDETLDLSQSRLVELEHLSDEVYAQLLPALAGEVVPRRVDESTEEIAGRRLILDFGVNRAEA